MNRRLSHLITRYPVTVLYALMCLAVIAVVLRMEGR